MENLNSGYLKDGSHHFFHRVYFSDTDAGGIVYHSKYLDMAEHGRTEMLRCLNLSHQKYLDEKRTSFVVRNASLDYQMPARMDEVLEVRTSVKKMNRFSMDMLQEVLRDGKTLVNVEIRLAYISMETGRPVAIPDEWKDAFQEIQTT